MIRTEIIGIISLVSVIFKYAIDMSIIEKNMK